MVIPSVLDFAHDLVSRTLGPGDTAIDATVGNGHDTLFLARTVGSEGEVVGFDIQKKALEAAQKRLREAGVLGPVRLVAAGHESMSTHLDSREKGQLGAVMFNLGYLPGSDRAIITRPDTTRRALETSCQWVRPGGIVTVVAYTGHEGGRLEAKAVQEWMSGLPEDRFQVLSYRYVNQTGDPPQLYAVEKRSS